MSTVVKRLCDICSREAPETDELPDDAVPSGWLVFEVYLPDRRPVYEMCPECASLIVGVRHGP